MSAAVDARVQPLGAYDYDHQRMPAPQFTNPWGSVHASSAYPQSTQSNDPYTSRSHYASQPAQPAMATNTMPIQRSYPTEYAASTSSIAPPYTSTTADRYSSDHYANAYSNYESRYPAAFAQGTRSFRPCGESREAFGNAIDASQGVVAMSQQDYTPRAVYPPRNGSTDSYGFPGAVSDHGSSISSASSYPYYGSYTGSAEGSVAGSSATDYSSNSSEEMGQRTLPPPNHLLSGYPPDATQMMTQFNSKMAASTQKKHKCKICDKRFTRPSSLQTHMYSHTGEKPFACNFEGCGRHFSVVSNLRRHTKCHKGDGAIDASSPDE